MTGPAGFASDSCVGACVWLAWFPVAGADGCRRAAAVDRRGVAATGGRTGPDDDQTLCCCVGRGGCCVPLRGGAVSVGPGGGPGDRGAGRRTARHIRFHSQQHVAGHGAVFRKGACVGDGGQWLRCARTVWRVARGCAPSDGWVNAGTRAHAAPCCTLCVVHSGCGAVGATERTWP